MAATGEDAVAADMIFELIGFSISVITPTVLLTAGALCVALHLAGVGHRGRAPLA